MLDDVELKLKRKDSLSIQKEKKDSLIKAENFTSSYYFNNLFSKGD